MKRFGIGALWVATIAATWLIVRGTTSTSTSSPTDAAQVGARSTRSAAIPVLALRDGAAPEVGDAGDPAFQAALATLERDLSDGRWSAADRDRLNLAVIRLPGHHTRRLFAVLFPKLNSGAVRSELDGPPI